MTQMMSITYVGSSSGGFALLSNSRSDLGTIETMVADEHLLLQFENALIDLQRSFATMLHLSAEDAVDPLAVHSARESYERAKLIWLSCDLRLRSLGVFSPFQLRQSRGILVYSATANIRESLASILKARGYGPTAVATVNDLHAEAQTSRFAAVLCYLEPAMGRAPSFAKYLERASQPLPLIALPQNPMGRERTDGTSIADRVSSPLASVFSELDRFIYLACSSRPTPP